MSTNKTQATPRTNEAAKRAVHLLMACNTPQEFQAAVKKTMMNLLSTARELELRVAELEAHLRAVCGLTVESGTKKIVETMNAAEAAITRPPAIPR